MQNTRHKRPRASLVVLMGSLALPGLARISLPVTESVFCSFSFAGQMLESSSPDAAGQEKQTDVPRVYPCQVSTGINKGTKCINSTMTTVQSCTMPQCEIIMEMS